MTEVEVEIPTGPQGEVDAEDQNLGRNVVVDTDSFFNHTAKKLFDAVMDEAGYKFDTIELDDLVGDNSTVMMSEFVQRCIRNPPVSKHTKRPFAASTLVDTLVTVIRKLKEKFRNQTQNMPPLFPEDNEREWKKKLKDSHLRNQMQGIDESEVLKTIFPLPRKHGIRTKIF